MVHQMPAPAVVPPVPAPPTVAAPPTVTAPVQQAPVQQAPQAAAPSGVFQARLGFMLEVEVRYGELRFVLVLVGSNMDTLPKASEN